MFWGSVLTVRGNRGMERNLLLGWGGVIGLGFSRFSCTLFRDSGSGIKVLVLQLQIPAVLPTRGRLSGAIIVRAESTPCKKTWTLVKIVLPFGLMN